MFQPATAAGDIDVMEQYLLYPFEQDYIQLSRSSFVKYILHSESCCLIPRKIEYTHLRKLSAQNVRSP